MCTVKKYFEEVSGKYKGRSSRGIWAYLRKLESVAVMEAIDPFEGMACLDLGCGTGFYTSRLALSNPKILVAVDISQNMLYELGESNIKRVSADIENIKFKIGFDRILCAGAIEFLPNIEGFLANLKDLLNETGTVVLLLPKKGIFGSIYRAYHLSHGISVDLYELSKLESLLKEFRLKINKSYLPTPMTHVLAITHE